MTEQLATIRLTNTENPDDFVEMTIPFIMADMQQKNDSIQKLGASLTYLRRYLYIQAYSLYEDAVVEKSAELKETQATEKQETTSKFKDQLTNLIKATGLDSHTQQRIAKKLMAKDGGQTSWNTYTPSVDSVDLLKTIIEEESEDTPL